MNVDLIKIIDAFLEMKEEYIEEICKLDKFKDVNELPQQELQRW